MLQRLIDALIFENADRCYRNDFLFSRQTGVRMVLRNIAKVQTGVAQIYSVLERCNCASEMQLSKGRMWF